MLMKKERLTDTARRVRCNCGKGKDVWGKVYKK
jgi:hypothetical protein